jgi:hypothetical protein
MDTSSFYMRNMLHQYGRQLVTSRRLARYHQVLRATAGLEPEMSPEMRRKILVERVSRELFENLLFTGNDSRIVAEVRRELAHLLGEDIAFSYPPGQLDISITRNGPAGHVEVSPEEKGRILNQVWGIIRARVDASML